MPTLIAPAARRAHDAATRGVLFVHSCPRALSPHVEWAVSQVLERPVTLRWSMQPVAPSTVRAELAWESEVGTAARLASSLLAFTNVRYEVTQDAVGSVEGERFSVTPNLGLFRASINAHGDIVIGEDRLRAAIASSARRGSDLQADLDVLLGGPWDEELEPFRYAGDGAPVRYLHQVG